MRAEPLDESGASCNRSDESIFLGEKRIASRNIASGEVLCCFAAPVGGARGVRNGTGTTDINDDDDQNQKFKFVF
jgi:hypothetical protein